MPRTGRPRKPTALLKLTGAYRKDRHGDAPELPVGLPPCPAWLGASSAELWPEVGAMLVGLGVMSAPMTLALAMLCEALADYVRGREPKDWDRVMRALRECGMTPSALASVQKVREADKPKTGLDSLKLTG
jgi:hypothetical protein